MAESVGNVSLLLTIVLFGLTAGTASATADRPSTKLQPIVCASGTTKIIPPHYYYVNSPDWCATAVGEVNDDIYNTAYREECQRWMGGTLPDRVAATQLEYCYEFPNHTIQYDMGVCCQGVLPDNTLRCFTGTLGELWSYSSSSAYRTGSLNYMINYGNDLKTCHRDEVCQTLQTFYGSGGTIRNITMSKGCVRKADCEAVIASGSCAECKLLPQCAECCETSFCNYNYTYYQLEPDCPIYACSSGPCQHGGTCIDVFNSTTGNYDFRCSCQIRWKGTYCNESRSLCASNRCLNGGTCYDYSDLKPDDFRCECPLPYIGDVCEMQTNITCNGSEDFSYQIRTGMWQTSCTQLTWQADGNPDVEYYPYYDDYIDTICHVGIDRPESSLRIYFEMRTCAQGDTYSWVTYHSCCQNRTYCTTNNPCLNGGTCYDWSDLSATGPAYRCECAPPYVGDHCEIPSNLTCEVTDFVYVTLIPSYDYSYNYHMMCTPRAWYAVANPNYVIDRYNYDNVVEYCQTRVRRPSDGHQFIQGVDGQISADMSLLEMKYCDYGDGYSRCHYHMCCPTCLSSPCQNGGYCIQLDYTSHVCKCTFGFNGDFCENKLSVCRVTGDPHYRTFDVRQFDYQGICKYNLASVCSEDTVLPHFQVFARSENRYGVTSVSYVWYVEMVYKNTTVRLINSGSGVGVPVNAFLDGTQIQIPYSGDYFRLYYSGQYVHYIATCGLSVDYDGNWIIVVNVPGVYSGKLCGLCGNNDRNAENDLTMANGTYVGDLPNGANLFGDSYVVDDPEQPDTSICPAPPPPPPCDPEPYKARCGNINDTSGIFSNCISKLPAGVADGYYEDCIMDACYTEGLSICATVKMFNEECRVYGAQISCAVWQPAVGCESESSGVCPPGMTFKCSVSACQPTCADPDASSSCSLPNTDACVCQPGELIFNGTCTTNCPTGCPDPNQQLRPIGDSWPVEDCSTATCVACSNCSLGATLSITSNCLPGQVCTNETCITIPTTPGPVQSTTESPAPDINPDPYVKMTLNGTANASGIIDGSCSSSFSAEFRKSFEEIISRANSAILNGQLCVGNGLQSVLAGAIQFMTLGAEAKVTFAIAAGINVADTVTIRSIELCAYDVTYFVQTFNNWRQPIIPNVYGCPRISFYPTTFNLSTAEWSCIAL